MQTRDKGIRLTITLSLVKMLSLWVLATFNLFLLLEALPGDAATNQIGKAGSEAVLELRQKMGLNQPIIMRYMNWLKGFVTGDLGKTYATEKNIFDIVKTPILSSLSVTGIVFSGLVFFTLPLAVYCGYYKNTFTNFIGKLSVLFSSVPEFISATLLLILFSLKLKILPVLSTPGPGKNVWQEPQVLIMPSLCLWFICSFSVFRYLKVMIEEYSHRAFVPEAYLSGLSQTRVLFIHLLPQALGGIMQILASSIPYLLGGAMIVETITSFPGMGYTLVIAIQSRETLLVMALGSLLIGISILSYRLADYLEKI